jgi:hypothetical protein
MITLGIAAIKAEIMKFNIPMTKPNNSTRQNCEKVRSKPSDIASPKDLSRSENRHKRQAKNSSHGKAQAILDNHT